MDKKTRQVPAREDVLVLSQDRHLWVDNCLATPAEGELVRLGLRSFGFCLQTEGQRWGRRTTLGEFARSIEAVVDCQGNAKNAQVVSALRKVHARMEQAARDMVMMTVDA